MYWKPPATQHEMKKVPYSVAQPQLLQQPEPDSNSRSSCDCDINNNRKCSCNFNTNLKFDDNIWAIRCAHIAQV